MDCNNVCRLCDRLILSQAVTFAGGTLTINIPAGSYNNGAKYCIVVAQAIPAATTINAPVVITIGSGTMQYPLVNPELTKCYFLFHMDSSFAEFHFIISNIPQHCNFFRRSKPRRQHFPFCSCLHSTP